MDDELTAVCVAGWSVVLRRTNHGAFRCTATHLAFLPVSVVHADLPKAQHRMFQAVYLQDVVVQRSWNGEPPATLGEGS